MSAMFGEIVWNSQTITMTLIFGLPVVGVLAGAWYKVNKVRSDNDLKRAMIDRGMSADEIARVLAASGEKEEEQ